MLLIVLELVLRANLLLEYAQIYWQSTIQPMIRYRVINYQREGVQDVAEPLIYRLLLPLACRGVIYVYSYTQGKQVAEEIDCLFYKATAMDKQDILEQQASGCSSWIIATSVLRIGIDIPSVVYIIYLSQLYRLTSFIQQVRHRGQVSEISDLIVILLSSSSSSSSRKFEAPWQELTNIYSVKAQDEATLTKYLESSSCWRAILAKYLDSYSKEASCVTTDSILYDQCQESIQQQEGSSSSGYSSQDKTSTDAIQQALQLGVQQNEQLEEFYQLLYIHYIYYQFIHPEERGESHCHYDYSKATINYYSIKVYQQQQSSLELVLHGQCFQCGLSQALYTTIEDAILIVFAARFASNQATDWLGRQPLGPCTPYLGFQKLGIRVSYRIARIFIIQLTLRCLLSLYNCYCHCPK